MRAPWLPLATVVVTLVVAYLVFALLLGATVSVLTLGTRECYLLIALSALTVGVGLRGLRRRGHLPDLALPALVLCGTSVLASLLAVDTFFDLREKRQGAAAAASELREPTLNNFQLRPRRFYPTARNFTIYKPDFQTVGWTYGDLDSLALRRSPTLMSSVLERRRVATSIDARGFRETLPMDEATVLALGDSYVHGPTISQELTWPKVLESITGVSVYNLGVDMSSPGQQVWLLEHVLTAMRPRRARRVLWMIFEGNDLEDDYSPTPPVAPPLFTQTLVGALSVGAPELVRNGSVLKRLLAGGFRSAASHPEWTIDGVHLPWPLWTSGRFGRAFALPHYIDHASKPASYVERHPNRPALETAFAGMGRLAEAHRLDVTVVLAPSFPRLYATAFGHADAVSREPHFLRFVERLAARRGFATVNLAELMRPYAERELLYFRDDTHWNARGNRVAAELIARHAFGR
jgi:hypothetical protein